MGKGAGKECWGEVGSCLRRSDGGRVATVFGFCFFGVIEGDPGGLPIWSGCLAAFGFVQVCSALFRVRGNGGGVDGGKFWQPLARLGLPGVRAGWRRCWERDIVMALLFWCERSRSWRKWGCAVVPACAGMTEGARE